MDEDDGYFSSRRVPGRSFEVSAESAQAIVRPDPDNSGGEENETSDSESEDTRIARYLNSTMDEVSDPEMWMNTPFLN